MRVYLNALITIVSVLALCDAMAEPIQPLHTKSTGVTNSPQSSLDVGPQLIAQLFALDQEVEAYEAQINPHFTPQAWLDYYGALRASGNFGLVASHKLKPTLEAYRLLDDYQVGQHHYYITRARIVYYQGNSQIFNQQDLKIKLRLIENTPGHYLIDQYNAEPYHNPAAGFKHPECHLN